MTEQAQVEDRHLGGRPPYGYQLVDGEPHPECQQGLARRRGSAHARGRPVTRGSSWCGSSPSTRRVRASHDRRGPQPRPHPLAPARTTRHATATVSIQAARGQERHPGDPHRTRSTPAGRFGTASATTRQLVSLDDVGLGLLVEDAVEYRGQVDLVRHSQTHEPLISDELCERRRRVAVGEHRDAVRKPRVKRTYCLSSRHRSAGYCGRRMAGQLDPRRGLLPLRVPLRVRAAPPASTRDGVPARAGPESPALDKWILPHFDPDNLDATIAAMAASQLLTTRCRPPGSGAQQHRRLRRSGWPSTTKPWPPATRRRSPDRSERPRPSAWPAQRELRTARTETDPLTEDESGRS